MSPSSFEQPFGIHEIASTSIKEQLKTLQFSAPSKNELSHLLTKTANDSIEASHPHQDEPEPGCEGELSHLCQDARNSIEEYLPLEDLAKLMRTSKGIYLLFGNTERGQKLKEANQLAREPFIVPPLSEETLSWIAHQSVMGGFGQ